MPWPKKHKPLAGETEPPTPFSTELAETIALRHHCDAEFRARATVALRYTLGPRTMTKHPDELSAEERVIYGATLTALHIDDLNLAADR